MAIIIFALWTGSLALGWLHQPHWLIVPPLFFSVYTIRENIKQMQKFPFGGELRQRAEAKFYATMIAPTVIVTLWSGALNAVIFGVGWLARNFILPIY